MSLFSLSRVNQANSGVHHPGLAGQNMVHHLFGLLGTASKLRCVSAFVYALVLPYHDGVPTAFSWELHVIRLILIKNEGEEGGQAVQDEDGVEARKQCRPKKQSARPQQALISEN